MDTHKNTRLTFDIASIDHKKLKAIAALSGVSIKDLVVNCIKENLLSDNIPNEETLQVFKDTDEGKNLIHCDSIDDLFEKLGLK